MQGSRLRSTVRDAALVCLGAFRRALGRDGGDRIVTLHDVDDGPWLRERLAWLRTRARIVGLEELLAPPATVGRRVAITLDDGFSSWAEVVAPILVEEAVPATLFVSSGFVGLEGEEARRFVRERLRRSRDLQPLSLGQLRELASAPGITIGGHSTTHEDLGGSHSRDVLRAEIDEDRRRLVEWTGQPVDLFAYPFGGYSNVSRVARERIVGAGYRAAFTIVPGRVETARDPYLIPRDSLGPHRSDLVWDAQLRGAYDVVARIRHRVPDW